MTNFNSNIDANSVIAHVQQEEEAKKVKKAFVTFDPKNYLNARLEKSETSKTMTIRLLPPSCEGGFPFLKVFMHTVKVNKKVSDNGWKSLVCPIHNHMGEEKCPYCTIAEEARKLRFASIDDAEKKRYQEIENLHRAKEMWVVRCIERGHEDEGVKFWMIPNSKDGAYAKIMNVWKRRWDKGQEKGIVKNIFDLNEGKDLEITLAKGTDGKVTIGVVDADDPSPLSENYEQGLAWLQDTKTWQDMYKVKPYEYMSILAQGGVPTFNKELNKYVDAEDLLKQKAEEQAVQVTVPTVDYSTMPTTTNINSSMVMDYTSQHNEEEDMLF